MALYLETTDYLRRVMSVRGRKQTIKDALKKLKYHHRRTRIDALVVRGVSGLLVGPEISNRMGVELIVLRKGESTHGHAEIEIPPSFEVGYGETTNDMEFNYVILDDFISSGTTVVDIINGMRKYFPNSHFGAFYGWYSQDWKSRETLTQCDPRGNHAGPDHVSYPLIAAALLGSTGNEKQRSR